MKCSLSSNCRNESPTFKVLYLFRWREKMLSPLGLWFHITILRCSTGLNKKNNGSCSHTPAFQIFVIESIRQIGFFTDLFPICWSLKLLGTFATDIPDALYLVLIYAFRNAFPKSDLYSVYFYYFVDYYFFCDRLCIKEYKFVKSIILCWKDL